KANLVKSRLLNLDSHVEPLAGISPAHIELVLWWMHRLVWIFINVIVIFGVRSVHAFLHPKLVQIGAVSWVQGAAAFIFRVGVVICDPFATEVIVGALHSSGNLLRPAVIDAVVKWAASIVLCRTGWDERNNYQSEQQRT